MLVHQRLEHRPLSNIAVLDRDCCARGSNFLGELDILGSRRGVPRHQEKMLCPVVDQPAGDGLANSAKPTNDEVGDISGQLDSSDGRGSLREEEC